MKLVSYQVENQNKFGIAKDNGIVDLTKRVDAADLKSLLAADLAQVSEFESEPVDYTFEEVTFLPVIPKPNKIFCAGVNYDDHRREVNRDKTEKPVIFFRLADSQIGHNEAILLPQESDVLDYEGEVAVIIGKPGRRIPKEQAYEHVAGYACYNDATIRDWQRHTHQWGPGKNFEGTGAFGPWMVTRDEIEDNEILTLETRLNGETLQHTTTDLMIFSIPELIHYVSSFITLVPGDVIVTGTPGGVGFKRNPQVLMKAGDVVEVEVSKLGTLRNQIKEG
ncbi:fumarylacetoacetate hydrolase family protein [Neobacillus rhizophilus]|uniref:Fumarylacetoacetate hydrolase family protein n=1 Tax=Neobacillus rhizophilus TaxID=2833579 RepID=A0A942YWN7_9BACI|nr:fumarylacetoacetate hydrolase family protein [Neobacillus rhizophilus]MBS4212881.1 fumarylacetoacetate hydrolase family protein [Neobacillus rhizophilus]MBU8918990.1 fumarylacetoacetate hydrolase family protein [Bacillus sp. FJAT-29953]